MKPRERDWRDRMLAARAKLVEARKAIDALTELAPEEVDQHLCYAGNTVHGADALLDRADAAFQRKVSRE